MSRYVSVRMERDAIEVKPDLFHPTREDLSGLRRFEQGEPRWYGVTADGRSERISWEEAAALMAEASP